MGADRRENLTPNGARSVRIEGNVQGSVVITGDGNVVTFRLPPGGGLARPVPPEGPGIEALYPALLRIRGPQDVPAGVGFLIGLRTALTCAHVLEAARAPNGTVQVDFPLLPNAPRLLARAVQEDPTADVAVLELTEASPDGAAPLVLKEGGDLRGRPFRAFGFPKGYPDGVWASGVIRAPDAQGRLLIEDIKETGYRVQPGFSGSPVWDDALGGVVGMVVAVEMNPTIRAACVIPTSVLRRFCPDARPGVPAVLPPNPFTDVLAVKDPAPFVGRERLLERALRLLEGGSVALVGERKVGKSSVLWQLQQRLESDWEVVLFWGFFEPISARALLRKRWPGWAGMGRTGRTCRALWRAGRWCSSWTNWDLALERDLDLDMLRGCRLSARRNPVSGW